MSPTTGERRATFWEPPTPALADGGNFRLGNLISHVRASCCFAIFLNQRFTSGE
jgi:hypothetical protein